MRRRWQLARWLHRTESDEFCGVEGSRGSATVGRKPLLQLRAPRLGGDNGNSAAAPRPAGSPCGGRAGARTAHLGAGGGAATGEPRQLGDDQERAQTLNPKRP